MKVIRGIIDTTSTTPIEGLGFTLTNNAAAGDMTITFTAAFSDIPAVTFTARYAAGLLLPHISTATPQSTSVVRVEVRTGPDVAADAILNFIAIGPR